MTPAAKEVPARIDLPHRSESVARARSFVRKVCGDAGLPLDLCDVAVLLTSETVTNSLRHGRGNARLAVTAAAGGLLVEVGDDDPQPPRPRSTDPDALDGRGMAIIDLLSTEWGSYGTPGGKVVWFRLEPA